MIAIRKLVISLTTLLVVTIVLTACDKNPGTPADSDQAVQTTPINSALEPRVVGRWDKLMARHFDEAYEFFSPAYRKLYSVQHYLSKTGSSVDWLSVEVNDIQFDGVRAEVQVEVEYRLELPIGQGANFGEMSTDIKEVWLWRDGEWWYASENNKSPF